MYFTDAYRRFTTGVQAFVPENEANFAQGKPTRGFGMIRYAEGSVYYGDVFFDGKAYNKLGFGRQDFLLSEIGSLDPERKIRRAFYIGEFDYRETDWIYGNGVIYYVNENNRPACFVKGFYEGLDITGPYTGRLTQEMLPDGYTMEMEAFSDHWTDTFNRQMQKLSGVEELENLFIGDSYFELWDIPDYAGGQLFERDFLSSRNLNLGIGGSCFSSWMRFLPELTALPQPKRIFLNLGFNDLHRHKNPDRAYGCYLSLLKALKKVFPSTSYYLLNVVQCPNDLNCQEIEEQFNFMTAESAKSLGVSIVDMRTAIQNSGGLQSAFSADRIHLNAVGYAVMTQEVKKIVEG